MLVFLSVIENIVVLCHLFCCFRPQHVVLQLKRAVERRKNFIMPGHYKKIMPAQQPIRTIVGLIGSLDSLLRLAIGITLVLN